MSEQVKNNEPGLRSVLLRGPYFSKYPATSLICLRQLWLGYFKNCVIPGKGQNTCQAWQQAARNLQAAPFTAALPESVAGMGRVDGDAVSLQFIRLQT